MNRRVKIGIMVALLVLAVGFAAITTTLIINGTLSIGPDSEGFDQDVIFTKASSVGNAYITDNGKTIQFSADLQDIGQEVDLKFEITNKNRQYDAEGTIECGFVDEDNALNGYITITPSPDSFSIEASRKKTGHVTVRMIRSYIGSEDNSDDDDPVNAGEIEFKCTIKLEAGERDSLAPELPDPYSDSILNGADPVLTGGLIPVTITNNGTVEYADVYESWYDYSNKQWANAVILVDGAGAKYDEGDVINEDDIQAYFVWVPKYKYKLWNVDTVSSTDESLVQSIDIIFGTENTVDEEGVSCATPMVAGESGNCDNGEYMTHPAFISMDVNGLWVAKFETGYADATSASSAQSYSSNVAKIVIKPNQYAWRSNTLYNFFLDAYNYNRAADSHLIKNTEWGAVAYLSHSVYGINGKITANNNSSYMTGYSGTSSEYNTTEGYTSSTTGNITGIYDMSGGAQEYVVAHREGNLGTSGFTTKLRADYDDKYFDVYPSDSTATSYNYRILGDATGELSPYTNSRNSWYSDTGVFVTGWASRGGSVGDIRYVGIFNFQNWSGYVFAHVGSRIVLAPQ